LSGKEEKGGITRGQKVQLVFLSGGKAKKSRTGQRGANPDTKGLLKGGKAKNNYLDGKKGGGERAYLPNRRVGKTKRKAERQALAKNSPEGEGEEDQ